MLDSVFQDLRHALRLARSSPALISIAVASLALGIGVTVSMFTLVNAVLLRPVPVDSPEEPVHLDVRRGEETEWREIVGIVRDSKYRNLGEEPTG